MTYVTGPITGPVQPGDVREVDEAAAEVLLRDSRWQEWWDPNRPRRGARPKWIPQLDKLYALWRDRAAAPGERRNAAAKYKRLTGRPIRLHTMSEPIAAVYGREQLSEATVPPRLVIPFVADMLAEEVRGYGEEHDATFVDLTGDDQAYYELLVRLWSAGRAFIIVEQDILPAAGVLDDMQVCTHDWCASLHRLHDKAPEVWSLGLMRFSTRLLSRRYSLGEDGQTGPNGAEMLAQVLGQDRRWQRVDLCLYTVLRMGGYEEPHLHGPAGRHLHHEMQARRAAVAS